MVRKETGLVSFITKSLVEGYGGKILRFSNKDRQATFVSTFPKVKNIHLNSLQIKNFLLLLHIDFIYLQYKNNPLLAWVV